jgi:hypothetical protein
MRDKHQQDENPLDDEARARLEERLVRWIEGEEAQPLGLLTDTRGRVRVVARFPEGVWDRDVERLTALGLDVENGDLVATGAFDREGLLALAHDRAVHGIGPVGRAFMSPAGTPNLPED